jgi:hypothetical protein
VWLPAEDNSYAAALVFASHRLCADATRTELSNTAVAMLQRNQRIDGSWAHSKAQQFGDIETTAACIHALAVTTPRGWHRQAKKAALWLQTRQSHGGHWVQESSPDPVYLTVLVLDALTLASGSSSVTFRKPEVGLTHQSFLPTSSTRRFSVAVSFPGEIRPFVEIVVRNLQRRLGNAAVFYDNDHKAELAGPDLDLKLLRIYRDDSQLIVVFLAPGYSEKEWCGLEWRYIRELLKTGRGADLMFLRMKNAGLPAGMLSIDGYVDVATSTESEVANLIVERLRKPPIKQSSKK